MSSISGTQEAFLQHGLYLRNWSPRTVRTYRQGLATLRDDLNKATLDAWVIGLRARGVTPGGVNMCARSVNSYLSWLHEEGHLPVKLRVRLMKAPAKVPTLLSAQEVRTILLFKPKSKMEWRT